MKPKLFSLFAISICAAMFSTNVFAKSDYQLPVKFEPANSQIKRKLLNSPSAQRVFSRVLPKWVENYCRDGASAVPKCRDPSQLTNRDMFEDLEIAQVNLDDDNVDDVILLFGHKTGLSTTRLEGSTHIGFFKGTRNSFNLIGHFDMPNIAAPFIDEFNPRKQYRDLVFLSIEDEGELKYLIEKMVFNQTSGKYERVDRFKEAQAACKAWDAYNFVKLISQDRDVFKKFKGPQMWVGEKSVNGDSAPLRQVSTQSYDELQFSYLNGLWYKSGQEDFEHPEFYKVNFRKNLTNTLFVRFQAAHIDAKSREPSETHGPIHELEFTPNGAYGCWELYSSTTIAE